MPANVVLTFEHMQAALIVFVGYSAIEHYRLLEVLTDLSRFSTWSGKLFLLSLLAYTAAFTYCATDLSLRLNQIASHQECECADCICVAEQYSPRIDYDLGKPMPRLSPLSTGDRPARSLLPPLVGKTATTTGTLATSINEDEDEGMSPLLIPHRQQKLETLEVPNAAGRGCLLVDPDPQGLKYPPAKFSPSDNSVRRRSILKSRPSRMSRRVSVVEYREKKCAISVAFAQVKRHSDSGAFERVYKTLDECEYDMITCRTLSLNIYIPLILGHATSFVLVSYSVATYPVYGWAALPLIILAYAGLMNANSLLRHMVPRPTARWIWVAVMFLGLYHYRLWGAGAPPPQFSATTGDVCSIVLVLLGAAIALFYAAFVLGCSLQCALKNTTLHDVWKTVAYA